MKSNHDESNEFHDDQDTTVLESSLTEAVKQIIRHQFGEINNVITSSLLKYSACLL